MQQVVSVGSPVVAYDPGLVLLEGPLFKQVSGTFGRKSWKLRWTALVPNALLSFSSDSLPKPGAVAKDVVVLEHATLEGVDEIEAKRPFVFCVGSEGKETQFATASSEDFDRWTQVVDQHMYLLEVANAHNYELDEAGGGFVDRFTHAPIPNFDPRDPGTALAAAEAAVGGGAVGTPPPAQPPVSNSTNNSRPQSRATPTAPVFSSPAVPALPPPKVSASPAQPPAPAPAASASPKVPPIPAPAPVSSSPAVLAPAHAPAPAVAAPGPAVSSSPAVLAPAPAPAVAAPAPAAPAPTPAVPSASPAAHAPVPAVGTPAGVLPAPSPVPASAPSPAVMNPTPAAPVPHAPAPESLSSVEYLQPSSGGPSPVTAPPLPAPAVVIQDVPHSHAGIPADAAVTHRKPSDAASNPTPTPGQAPAPSAPIKSTPTPAGEGKSASIPSSLVSDTPSAARASVAQSLPSPAVIDDFRTIKSQAPPVPDVGTRDGTPGSVDNAFIGGPPSRSMSSFANSITPDADGQSPPDQPKPHPIASYGVALPQPMRPSVATPNVDKRVVIQEPPIGVQVVDSLVPSSVKKGPPRPPNAADTATAKRAFDAATASRFDGLLPLHELPQLAEQLGVPMDEYYLEDYRRLDEIDPSGDRLLSRSEFLAWWSGHSASSRPKMPPSAGLTGRSSALLARTLAGTPSVHQKPSVRGSPSPYGIGSERQFVSPLMPISPLAHAAVQTTASVSKFSVSSRRDDADYKDTASLLSAQAKPAAAVDMTPRGGFGFDAELAAALTSTRSPAPQALALAAPTAPKSLDPFVKVFADDAPIVSPAAVPTTLLTERSGRFPKPKAPIGPLPSLDGVIRSPLADVGLACSALVKPMQTVEEARLGVQPGDPTSMSGKAGSTAPLTGIVGLGTGLDLATIANSIKSYEFDESEWNERWQRLSEKPAWSFEKAVEKAVAMSAFVGKFNSLSRTIVETLVDEMALPFHLKSIKPMEGDYADPGPDGATSLKPGSPVVYYSNGLLFRVIPADDESQHISSSSNVGMQRKMAAQELSGIRWMSWACDELFRDWLSSVGPPDVTAPKRRPPSLCTALATIVDYVGFRVFVSCVPPVDEHRTIVYGRLGPSEPFAKHSSMVFSMFKRVARHLNLKTHQAEVLSYSDTAEGEYSRGYPVDAASGVYDEDASYERHNAGDMGNLSQPASTLENQTINLCVPVSVQGHQCDDHRFYATELARLFPSDSPALRSADTLVRILRPELVLKAAYPLSADAYCSSDLVPPGWPSAIGMPTDAEVNDDEAAEVSKQLVDDIIPAFVAELDSFSRVPCTSAELSTAMHFNGINIRYLGRIAVLTKLPHIRELAEVEMIARVAKHVLIAPLRRLVEGLSSTESTAFLNPSAVYAARSHVMVAKREIQAMVVDFLNLVLGNGPKSRDYWRQVLEPCVQSIFGYNLTAGLLKNSLAVSSVSDASSTRSESMQSQATHAGTTSLYKPQLFIAIQEACGLRIPLVQVTNVGAVASVVLSRPKGPATVPTLFDSASPLAVTDLTPVTPNVKSARTGYGQKPLECCAVAQSGEALFGTKDFHSALQAFNLRLALFQAQGDGTSVRAAETIVWIAKMLIQLERYVDAVDVLKPLFGEMFFVNPHITVARAYIVKCQALILMGHRAAALEAFACGITAAEWHLGRFHPVLCELDTDVANALIAVGDFSNAAQHLARARDLAVTSLGPNHSTVASLSLTLGDLLRALGERVAACYPRAQAEYERALSLYDAIASDAAGESRSKSIDITPSSSFALYHATASAGVSACTSLQGLHAECVASSQRTLVLLEQATVSVGFTSTSNLTMSTLQVLAASLEALGRYTDAIQCMQKLLAHAKKVVSDSAGAGDAFAVAIVQSSTRATVRLAFKALPAFQRSLVDRVRVSLALDTTPVHTYVPKAAMETVIGTLLSHSSPGQCVNEIVSLVQASSASGQSTSQLKADAVKSLLALAVVCG